MKKSFAFLIVLFSFFLLIFSCCGNDDSPSPNPPPQPPPDGDVLAFPGAEGAGKYTTGGRGGDVLVVTRLDDVDDFTTGTLRWALRRSGSRTVIFAVQGVIELQRPVRIQNGNLTVLGQSAPGEGICIKNHPVTIEADNVIMRFLRFRLGDEFLTDPDAGDALTVIGRKNIMIDHCSFSWGTDETLSAYDNENFTLQYSIISESLTISTHSKGRHGYGGIWGGNNVTFHHNLLAHHYDRNPRFDHDCVSNRRGPIDFVNNVIYNWGNRSSYGGENRKINIVNNYYKAGPASSFYSSGREDKIIDIAPSSGNSPFCRNEVNRDGRYYITGNFVYRFPAVTVDNWTGVARLSETDKNYFRVTTAFPVTPSISHNKSAEDAFKDVLGFAGASLSRDRIDARIVEEVENGTFNYEGSKFIVDDRYDPPNIIVGGRRGLIDLPSDVGGWPDYLGVGNNPAQQDTDGDRIPDWWEIENGLDPNDHRDRDKKNVQYPQYTNLEVYLNDIVKHLYPR